ncbi:5,10-methylene-tetrahydrofolate dehydrogenase [Virgibacillus sp. NKC19-3]|uniref:5,10-methylene-tetrahydrofolate dehydrogenase n=1 Tax=Virgibacillus saliphilus TaxID=2831674 RepID=UPI001C9B9822|nr:5,10-methylene-tetrahydrofolate dehydrogenase [Virgibacillus sp. NKC19-3]MBY7145133.1 5,10-methylene-tetrahydrofolate dehydrogenase [Virgibacillus sp. NKC19-3]
MTNETKVGLIAAPELPAEIAADMAEALPAFFAEEIDEHVNWSVETVMDPVTGFAESVDDILEGAVKIRKQHDWNYAICLTDLPIFLDKNIIVTDINNKHDVAQLSIPAFGWVVKKEKVKKAIITIMDELYHPSEENSGRRNNSKKSLEKQFPLSRVRRVDAGSSVKEADKRYTVVPRFNGKIRLLLGMTQANKPWSIMSSFKKVIAVAFTTGAFASIFPTMWTLSHLLSESRLTVLSLVAISLMVVWLIVSHNLWETPASGKNRFIRRLYNRATVMTLILSVITYYAVLFTFFLILVVTLVPLEAYQSLTDLDGAFTFINYVKLAWILASITTVTGAIGASLEDEEMVKDITYGYRQKRRYKESANDDA